MSSTKLLKNGTVITFDETTQKVVVLFNASILIIDNRINAIAQDPAALHLPEDVEITDCTNKILSPGFVNTHIHMWQTAYRSMGPDVTLPHYFDWTSQASKLSRSFTADELYVSTLEGYLEGINAGVTSFVDHAHNNWSKGVIEKGYEAAVASGARAWWCFEPHEWPEEYSKAEQWQVFQDVGKKNQRGGRRVEMGLGYNGLGGTTGEEFEFLKTMIKDNQVKAITTHHLGGSWPARHSSPPDLVAQDLHTLSVPLIISHAPYLSSSEISCCRDHNIHISITPESEFHYGHGQATGHLISDQVSLGVDTNWTFSGDLLSQARFWLQTVRNRGFQKHLEDKKTLPRNTPFPVEQGFLLATRQGGRALWRDDIGVLKVGAKADIVVFDTESPNMLGWTNAVAAVMLHANVGDVEHVMVDGVWRKRDFRLVNTDEVNWSDVKIKFVEAARRIQHLAFPQVECTKKLWGLKETGMVDEWSTIRGD